VSARHLPITLLCLTLSLPAMADWPTHRGNVQRTGNTDGKPGPAQPKLLWHAPSQNQFISSPALSAKGDRLYISSLGAFNSGFFFGISTDEKAAERVVWTKRPPFLQKPAVSSPVLADGLLFFGDGMHQTDGAILYAVRASDGLPVWKYDMPGELVHMEGSPVADKNRIYMGAGNGGVFCVDANKLTLEGKEYDVKSVQAELQKRWKALQDAYQKDKKDNPDFAMEPTDTSLPAVKPKLLWQQGKDQWHVDSALAVTGDRVLAASAFLDLEGKGERALFCLKASDGSQLWKTALTYNPWGGPTVAGNVVLVGCSNIRLDPSELGQAAGEVVAIDLDKGTVLWKEKIPGGVVSSIAVKDSIAVVTATDGKVRAFNIADGKPRWTYTGGAPYFAAPAIAGKVVYSADLKGVVHAIDLEKGTKVWTFDVAGHPSIQSPGMFYSAPVIHGGKIYLATCNLYGETAWKQAAIVCIGEK
jgi:outer membrane protein assembly factor BamB